MSVSKMKSYRIAGSLFGILFIILFSVRIDLIEKLFPDQTESPIAINKTGASGRDVWMNIFQSGHKIGFSRSVFSEKENGYNLIETVFMRINTLGMVQDIDLRTEAELNPDYTLSSVNFRMSSGRFSFEVTGTVSDRTLSLETRSFGDTRKTQILLEKKPYITAGLVDAIGAAGYAPGDTFFFEIFDPSTMAQETVTVNIMAKEEIMNMGSMMPATRIALDFKGAVQQAWVGEDGQILKQEGLLGITMERTTREDALFGLAIESGQDLTEVASVESNLRIENPSGLDMLRVEISGIRKDNLDLDGGRQKLDGDVLTIRKESLTGHIRGTPEPESLREFLKPTPFIQSDHKNIRKLADNILSTGDTREEKARRLIDWIYKHIEKRPVLSLPDAISTLENRMGDCNEHSVLLAALSRAAGIPARVEAGLVYLKGRFYYHAWNSLYIGEWITADSVFGQFPADVTHIRFVTGEQADQSDLMGVIGKVRLEVRSEE